MESPALMTEHRQPALETESTCENLDVFSEVYREHSRAIYYLALRFLGDPSQAEDVTHDVFIKAYRNRNRFRGDSSVRTWLYHIALNHCRNAVKTWHKRHIFSNADESLFQELPCARTNPLQNLETKELGERIQRTLENLTEEYRLLLLLAADEKLPYNEIALLTGQSPDAVRGKLYRARKAFIQHFQTSAR